VAGEVWVERSWSGKRQAYKGLVPKIKRKKALVGVGVGEATVQASRWTVRSGRTQTSG